MKHDHDTDDLLVLARRGDLSTADERRLRDVLRTSDEAQILYDAGRTFDRSDEEISAERVDALARAVQRRMRPRDRRRLAWTVRLCIAAALIVSAAIGAGELWPRAPLPVPIPPTPPAPQTATATPTPAPLETTVPSETPAPVDTAPAPVMPSSAPPVQHVHTSAPAPAPAVEDAGAAPPPTLTAAELFAAANRARVAGDPALAIRLSHELEDRYPTSREGVSTHLSLGLLYLQQGSPAEALAEFRRYRAVGVEATMPEALWGESRALRQLGRSAEERTVLNDLLDRYPSSAYAPAARRRLPELP